MKDFLTGILGIILVNAINLAIGGFLSLILLSYWRWFIVPLGVRDISFFHAWGLLLIPTVFVLSSKVVGSKDYDHEQPAEVLGRFFVSGLFLWGFGYILSQLIV